MATINYLLATWSGKRRNPSKDYLRAQIDQLLKIRHNLTQITIIQPLGSDDPEYYKVFDDLDLAMLPIRVLKRPMNDRAYGQFLFAHDNEPGFDYYILVEDDYLPNLDGFDSHLIDLLHEKRADYLCGSYGPVPGGKVDVPRHNIGIMTGLAMNYLIAETPDWKFYPSGTNDGQEQEMFGDMCKAAGLTIADYSDRWPVPYYDRYLRYFSTLRGKETLFVPYQLLHHKAFGYHGESGNEDSHFLSTIEFHWADEIHCLVTDDGNIVGKFRMEQKPDHVEVLLDDSYKPYQRLITERIYYECRGRSVTIYRA